MAGMMIDVMGMGCDGDGVDEFVVRAVDVGCRENDEAFGFNLVRIVQIEPGMVHGKLLLNPSTWN
jgi:hypothetical protein